MKKICFLFFALFLAASVTFGQAFWDDVTSGSWKGVGTLMGSETEFEMTWKWVLGDQFLKLEFDNGRISSNAYYQPQSDSLFEGTWFDSRGITFPVKGTLKDSTFTVLWGSLETEQGKTVYMLVSNTEMRVEDYFLRDEKYVKFGEAKYQKY